MSLQQGPCSYLSLITVPFTILITPHRLAPPSEPIACSKGNGLAAHILIAALRYACTLIVAPTFVRICLIILSPSAGSRHQLACCGSTTLLHYDAIVAPHFIECKRFFEIFIVLIIHEPNAIFYVAPIFFKGEQKWSEYIQITQMKNMRLYKT